MKKIEKLGKMFKTDIHCHLDGSIRPKTMIWVDEKYDTGVYIKLDNNKKKRVKDCSVDEVLKYMDVTGKVKDLNEYLERFGVSIPLMQEKEVLERMTYELMEDMNKDNVIYTEIRFAPQFHTEGGLSKEEVVESVLRGIKRGEEEFNMDGNIILCAMRHMDERNAYEVLELVEKYKNRGVVALDLAGDEYNFPVTNFKGVLEVAKKRGIKITIHAGEARGAESVEKAIKYADRIGHGVNIDGDMIVTKKVIREKKVLEVAPKSNKDTNVVEDFNDYPLVRLLKQGVKISLTTDNRTMSNTTILKEIELLEQYFEIELSTYNKIFERGIMAAFIEEEDKKRLLKKMRGKNEKIIDVINKCNKNKIS